MKKLQADETWTRRPRPRGRGHEGPRDQGHEEQVRLNIHLELNQIKKLEADEIAETVKDVRPRRTPPGLTLEATRAQGVGNPAATHPILQVRLNIHLELNQIKLEVDETRRSRYVLTLTRSWTKSRNSKPTRPRPQVRLNIHLKLRADEIAEA